MKTILEIFYVRIIRKNVHYQRKQANLSKRGQKPDAMIRSLIQEKRRAESGKVEEQEFVVHSTSWRYEQGKVILTYIAYSDELDFSKGKTKTIAMKKLRDITRNSRKPRSKTELENKVVSHAMRHIAFLIRTGDQENFKSVLTPETIKVFEKLWVSLAGKVF